MKKYLFSFVIGVHFGLISCTTHCPSFNEEILSWIPYQEDDVIELYSQSKDSTIILFITSVAITHTTHYSQGSIIGCKKCRGECYDYIYISDHDGSNFRVDISSYGDKMWRHNYWIFDTSFDSYSELENFLFEKEEYDVVKIFENNCSNGTFKKLIIAKEIGVIGLIDIYGNIWVLKNNAKTKKSNERGNVVIKNVSSSC